MEVEWNPQCNSRPECDSVQNGSYVNLVYVKATGEQDIVHYFYSTIKSFSILIFKSDLKGKVQIDWDKILNDEPNSIQIKGSELFEESAYVVPSIFEFEDNEGKADLTKSNETLTFKTSELVWEKFEKTEDAIGVFTGKLDGEEAGNQTANAFKFVVRNRGTDSRDKNLPHLLLKPESTSLDLIMDVPANFHLSKYAVEMLFLSNSESRDLKVSSTMDDEYTPGTFKIWDYKFETKNKTIESYFQCKPIFYFWEPKALENSTLVSKYDIQDDLPVPSGISKSLFSGRVTSGMNFSFGIEGDEKNGFFHGNTNYSVWSFSVGLGDAPVEKMSLVVTLVIAVGFGLPAFIIIAGVLFMVVRKLRSGHRSEFEVLD